MPACLVSHCWSCSTSRQGPMGLVGGSARCDVQALFVVQKVLLTMVQLPMAVVVLASVVGVHRLRPPFTAGHVSLVCRGVGADDLDEILREMFLHGCLLTAVVTLTLLAPLVTFLLFHAH